MGELASSGGCKAEVGRVTLAVLVLASLVMLGGD